MSHRCISSCSCTHPEASGVRPCLCVSYRRMRPSVFERSDCEALGMVPDNGSSRDLVEATQVQRHMLHPHIRTRHFTRHALAYTFTFLMWPRVGMIRLQDWASGTGRIQLAETCGGCFAASAGLVGNCWISNA